MCKRFQKLIDNKNQAAINSSRSPGLIDALGIRSQRPQEGSIGGQYGSGHHYTPSYPKLDYTIYEYIIYKYKYTYFCPCDFEHYICSLAFLLNKARSLLHIDCGLTYLEYLLLGVQEK